MRAMPSTQQMGLPADPMDPSLGAVTDLRTGKEVEPVPFPTYPGRCVGQELLRQCHEDSPHGGEFCHVCAVDARVSNQMAALGGHVDRGVELRILGAYQERLRAEGGAMVRSCGGKMPRPGTRRFAEAFERAVAARGASLPPWPPGDHQP
eukprot:CAMPEP_0206007062 /NCGR_PEP_ID=MMETSP1464-20131121/5543_1 /ASSEMBLY_ACC=CAM_ASM_001124 /TAXON_ID=119497 /ORGANISM="Exanthemachrysis gayraliae, Strain RCC1523" /LENGTH=149 /DNA_ID=CAMNT_0053380551 /DNA_START=438 /DNA_END=885 /DNA_ORIENTATION=-